MAEPETPAVTPAVAIVAALVAGAGVIHLGRGDHPVRRGGAGITPA
jgi:hypothetical protein